MTSAMITTKMIAAAVSVRRQPMRKSNECRVHLCSGRSDPLAAAEQALVSTAGGCSAAVVPLPQSAASPQLLLCADCSQGCWLQLQVADCSTPNLRSSIRTTYERISGKVASIVVEGGKAAGRRYRASTFENGP